MLTVVHRTARTRYSQVRCGCVLGRYSSCTRRSGLQLMCSSQPELLWDGPGVRRCFCEAPLYSSVSYRHMNARALRPGWLLASPCPSRYPLTPACWLRSSGQRTSSPRACSATWTRWTPCWRGRSAWWSSPAWAPSAAPRARTSCCPARSTPCTTATGSCFERRKS